MLPFLDVLLGRGLNFVELILRIWSAGRHQSVDRDQNLVEKREDKNSAKKLRFVYDVE